MRCLALIGLILPLALPCASAQSVHVVNGGGPGALQAAINAAAEGDTVLVHGGVYGPTSVVAKSLTIVAEPELGTIVSGLLITQLGASQRCVVSGLDLVSAGGNAALRVLSCSGSVRLEAVRSQSASSVDGARVADSLDVAFVRCTSTGGAQTPSPGPDSVIYPVGRGLHVNASQVALYDSNLTGGNGQNAHFINAVFSEVPAGEGGAGLEAEGASTIFLGHCTLRGGNGGNGRGLACVHLPCGLAPTAGADGGCGVRAHSGASALVFDCTSSGGTGGLGGSGGQCCPQTVWPPGADGMTGGAACGTTSTILGSSAVLIAPHVVREQTPLALSVTGTPGDRVMLAVSTGTRWAFDPALSGVRLFGPSSRRIALGTIPGGGTLSTSLPIPALPPGVGAQNYYLQIVVQTGTGPFRLGSPAWLPILDSMY